MHANARARAHDCKNLQASGRRQGSPERYRAADTAPSRTSVFEQRPPPVGLQAQALGQSLAAVQLHSSTPSPFSLLQLHVTASTSLFTQMTQILARAEAVT